MRLLSIRECGYGDKIIFPPLNKKTSLKRCIKIRCILIELALGSNDDCNTFDRLPCGICFAASSDPDCVKEYSEAMKTAMTPASIKQVDEVLKCNQVNV